MRHYEGDLTELMSPYVWEIERLPREPMPDYLPELQIVEVPHEREISRIPSAVVIRPPIDSDGNFAPWVD